MGFYISCMFVLTFTCSSANVRSCSKRAVAVVWVMNCLVSISYNNQDLVSSVMVIQTIILHMLMLAGHG